MLYQKITWTVIHGKKLGRTLWFPTANIDIWTQEFSEWTYKFNIFIWENRHSGIGSYKKTTGLLEVHIFDFNADIYWEQITVIPILFLRENKHFHDMLDLKNQIQQDKKDALQKNIKTITFGTFDIVHPGHIYYLSEAKKYGDILTTIIATDENVEKFKSCPPKFWLRQRIIDIQNTHIPDTVIAGSNASPLSWIEEHNPDVVCIWYDQTGFLDTLNTYISERSSNIHIIRIDSYQADIYKSSLLKKN